MSAVLQNPNPNAFSIHIANSINALYYTIKVEVGLVMMMGPTIKTRDPIQTYFQFQLIMVKVFCS